MNAQDLPGWIKACFEAANHHEEGPLVFNLHEFPLAGISEEESKEFRELMTKKINEAACKTLISFYESHDQLEPEFVVQAMQHLEAYEWAMKVLPPAKGYEGVVHAVMLTTEGKIMRQVVLLKNKRIELNNFEYDVIHAPFESLREKIKSPALKELYSVMRALCDKDAAEKKLPRNQRASEIFGKDLFGDVLIFLLHQEDQHPIYLPLYTPSIHHLHGVLSGQLDV